MTVRRWSKLLSFGPEIEVFDWDATNNAWVSRSNPHLVIDLDNITHTKRVNHDPNCKHEVGRCLATTTTWYPYVGSLE